MRFSKVAQFVVAQFIAPCVSPDRVFGRYFDRMDSRQQCLQKNAGPAPRTGFAPVASKTRGLKDAQIAQYIKLGAYVRSVLIANNTVRVDECSSTST